jgi:hypothetical protein
VQGTTSYRFVLSRNADLGQPIIDQAVNATAYELPWRLDPQTAYFWQVTPADPVPGDPSPIFTFTTADGPPPQARITAPGDNAINGLLIALIFAFLTWAMVLAVTYRNRQTR